MQVTEFCKAIDLKNLNIIDGKVLIIWEWQVIQTQSDKDLDGKKYSVDYECSSPTQDSEPEADAHVETLPTHTIPFKVIGCNKERRYQQVLERASLLIDSGVEIPVELCAEPENPVDPNAIAFMCKIQDCFERVGYVVREAQGAVHDAIRRNEVIAVKFKWVKYQCDWLRCGPGFFAAVNITTTGVWPPVVVRSKSTR